MSPGGRRGGRGLIDKDTAARLNRASFQTSKQSSGLIFKASREMAMSCEQKGR